MAETSLSMSVMGTYRAGEVTAETWRTVARDARVDPDAFLDWVRDLCERIADVVQTEVRALEPQDTSAVTERFARRIRIRATQAVRALER